MAMAARGVVAGMVLFGVLSLLPEPAAAQSFDCDDQIKLVDWLMVCYRYGPEKPSPEAPAPDPLALRALKYAALSIKYKLAGLASYYSSSLDGSLTANGETFHNKDLTAAHLTLPLGTWVEVHSRATGRTIRCRINDRGPYARKFILDLSQAAAHALGVDVARDRFVQIRIIALPGEEPPPDAPVVAAAAQAAAATVASVTER